MTDSEWQLSTIHNSVCQVMDERTLWGQAVCQIWVPAENLTIRVPSSSLKKLNNVEPDKQTLNIAYTAVAAKVAEVLEGSLVSSSAPVLLAPIESDVIPLPHQVQALTRAIAGDGVRFLLADEVGLGKTIEAGLIMRELKLRGLVRRTLVVAPKGLATQWVSEMQTHFNEFFQLILGDDINAMQRLAFSSGSSKSAWEVADQVIVSVDSVKPIDKRRGWSPERIAEHNRHRFEDLLSAKWDLVIVDEAHRLGGSTDQVARYKLGRGLAESAPYMLLLSATPHQGKTDAFHRLVSLLDEDAFPDVDSVSRERVAAYVIRTEKRRAIDADGKPLFKPRRTQMVPIQWESRHHLQKLLYEAVTDYVREGYNQSVREKKHHFGFLMILMQRLVVSSTRAIRTTLGRRLEVLRQSEQEANLQLNILKEKQDEGEIPDEWYDMDGQYLLDELVESQISALQNEGRYVETLLEAAERCEQSGPDAKAEALINWIYDLQAQENDADLKVLIFTEFVPTQHMLQEFLQVRGITVAILNGSMDMDQRRYAQDTFMNEARILVSTDAGGEGLNLQFAHVVINYDIPWNPMRLEQRIGRVDRIGQDKIVQAINFVFEDSVEFHVREVLEQKLSVIFEEFGIDKTGDVLDSAEAGQLFEDVFTSAVLNPDHLEDSVDRAVQKIQDEIQTVRESSVLHGISDEPDAQAANRLRSHPLPFWVERMTVSYMNGHGGSAVQTRSWWDLAWPDGNEQRKCVFTARDAARLTDATLLSLENDRVRALTKNLPMTTPEQNIPRVLIDKLPVEVTGYWGLFEIRIETATRQQESSLRIPALRRGFSAIFQNEEGKLFLPTARHIWDSLLTTDVQVSEAIDVEESKKTYQRLLKTAEMAGEEVFMELRQVHLAALANEENRGAIAFNARRKAIERVGLPEVRRYRMTRCEQEEADWRKELQSAREVVPEIRPLLLMSVSGGQG
jgi:superfamily II DNA or RNA helicase